MRHHGAIRKLGRKSSQRKALLAGLARSLILKEKIQTTTAKAKEVRPFVERLVTLARVDTVANRRLALSRLDGKRDAVGRLFKDVAPKYKERRGGYTRIMKLGKQGSDARDMALIEFV